MRQAELYQWEKQLAGWFGQLKKWQVMGLALWTLGIILAERCTISKVAEELQWLGKADTVERRLQRWLANPRLPMPYLRQQWIKWVVSWLGDEPLMILVDETKLGHHLGVMVVGIAYRGCCIPVAWWCYHERFYPWVGQVGMIVELLAEVQRALSGCSQRKIIEVDRGIGTSPELTKAMLAMPGYDFLWRVQGQVHFRPTGQKGQSQALKNFARQGQPWTGKGEVFKKNGWVQVYAYVYWDKGYTEPWCLISNCADLCGKDYALRYWQEAAFRDFKSDGWHWQRSPVWTPDHAERLLLVMTIAYGWTLSLGTYCAEDEARRRTVERTKEPVFSVFRLGLRYCKYLYQNALPLFFQLYLIPEPLLQKSVVV